MTIIGRDVKSGSKLEPCRIQLNDIALEVRYTKRKPMKSYTAGSFYYYQYYYPDTGLPVLND